MDWEKLFRPQILERGYDYYNQGLVQNFKQTKTKISAQVLGSELYDVNIKLKKGAFFSATCGCNYSQGGKNCKHMAAVMVFADTQNTEADVLVSKASNKQVRDFLSVVLDSDEHLFDLFQSLVIPESDNELNRYKKQINNLISKNADSDGFISYYMADRFENDMYNFIWNNVMNLVNQQDLELAFKILEYITLKLSNLDIDDSSGGLMRIAEYCDDAWDSIIEQANPDLEMEMFNWFLKQYDRLVIFQDIFDNLLLNYFNDKEFLNKKLAWSEKRFNDIKASKDNYEVSKLAFYHVQIMQKMELPVSEINQFCLANDNYSEVRMIYIDNCIQAENYQAAIDSLIDGKTQFKNWRGIVSKYSCKLKDVYRITKQTDNYFNEMWLILTDHGQTDMDVYREYKQQFSDAEWEVQREKLFGVLTKNGTDIDQLYMEDQLWDRLLDSVLKSNGLYSMDRYEGILKKKYPKEILKKYEIEVQQLASSSGSRGHYRQIVRILKHMATMDGGYELTSKIIADWKIKYVKRPAMLDELRNFDQGIY